jgi:virulence-associated protein VagC
MSTATAKVFTAGNSQALRLPKAFRVHGKTLQLSAIPGGFMAVDPAEVARRQQALKRLWGSCPDFPAVRP